jgi:acetyl-CoA C-acetyltransferase
MREAVIVAAVRTPIGTFNGSLSQLPAPELGGSVIKDALKRVSLGGDEVDEVIMGNVLTAGLGQAPARQASLAAGIPTTVGCTTINKVCGSGLKAVMLAAQAILVGEAEIVVAGGMESMSNSPYLLRRSSFKKNDVDPEELIDGMIKDGLWDVYNDCHMGEAAELCAKKFDITRKEQDAFAILSYQRAIRSQETGYFNSEIVPVTVLEGLRSVDLDEELKKFDPEKLKNLKPAFKSTGTITAGNASSISDGAAAVVVMEKEKARSLRIDPLVRIVGSASSAGEPEWFTLAPVEAILSLVQNTGRSLGDVDLFEINEAFAVSSIAVNRKLRLDPEKVNIRGGAIALGHPIGASGARILTTLIHSLADLGKTAGVVALCIGGGEAVSLMVERV